MIEEHVDEGRIGAVRRAVLRPIAVHQHDRGDRVAVRQPNRPGQAVATNREGQGRAPTPRQIVIFEPPEYDSTRGHEHKNNRKDNSAHTQRPDSALVVSA